MASGAANPENPVVFFDITIGGQVGSIAAANNIFFMVIFNLKTSGILVFHIIML